jgi:hypothetical protein
VLRDTLYVMSGRSDPIPGPGNQIIYKDIWTMDAGQLGEVEEIDSEVNKLKAESSLL